MRRHHASIRRARASCTPSISSGWRPVERRRGRGWGHLGRSRHADRHRQSHADDQRPGRPRLGRRRARGRRRHFRPAGHHADSRSRRRALTGRLREGVIATDLALLVTHLLRQIDLSGRFVEFFGPASRRCRPAIAPSWPTWRPSMARRPAIFPIDRRTLDYLSRPGARPSMSPSSKPMPVACGLWFDPDATPAFKEVIETRTRATCRCARRAARPQDLIEPRQTRARSLRCIGQTTGRRHMAIPSRCGRRDRRHNQLHQHVRPAPAHRCGPGRPQGARPWPGPAAWVKTSLAPGSPTAERYLRRWGLLEELEAIGFASSAIGCTTCIGNSGALAQQMNDASRSRGVLPVAVISGNRNFPGRVHPRLEAGFSRRRRSSSPTRWPGR